jgi:hypothetical protein
LVVPGGNVHYRNDGSGGIPLATCAKLNENMEVFSQKFNALMEHNDFGEGISLENME